MGKFREWLREAEEKTTEYQKFFAKKLEKYGVKSPSELSDEDKKKFYDEVDSEWKGEDEKPEADDINEAKQMVDKKQLEWFIGLANKAKNLDELIEDLELMKGLVK
jgi:hypothetical protein